MERAVLLPYLELGSGGLGPPEVQVLRHATRPPSLPAGSCHVHTNTTVLRLGDCFTKEAVNVPFCQGLCPGLSR